MLSVFAQSIYVTKVQPGGPASYGLVPGDRILEVSNISLKSTTKKNQCDVVSMLLAESSFSVLDVRIISRGMPWNKDRSDFGFDLLAN